MAKGMIALLVGFIIAVALLAIKVQANLEGNRYAFQNTQIEMALLGLISIASVITSAILLL